MALPPLEGSFLSSSSPDAKSSEFQAKLSRLMETKRQRYSRENKNAAIVAANQKKRKNARERERVDRHKAIERELEDIEAEFSLTMQPLSPVRNNNNGSSSNMNNNNGNINGRVTPGSKTHSPKQAGATARFSPMPSRITASPARNNIAALSPGRSNMMRGRGGAGGGHHSRQNSLGGGSHRKQNSLGASPFRKFSPRTRYPHHAQSLSMGGGENGDIFRGAGGFEGRQSSNRLSPPGAPTGDVVETQDYKPKFRPVNLHGSDRFSGPQGGHDTDRYYNDLSLPLMAVGGGPQQQSQSQQYDAKYRSPQAVIDEVLQSGDTDAPPKPRYGQSSRHSHHQRSVTPVQKQQQHMRRRGSSSDVEDSYHRGIRQSSSSLSSSSQLQQHPIIRHGHASPGGGSGSHHRRVQSSAMVPTSSTGGGGSGSHHKRSNSHSDDIFLHGVVAQTRFV